MNRAGHGFPAPGWFGKLPGSGDFVHRRLEAAFIVRWDAWLQHEMLVMRQRHPGWVESYLTAPVWCFVLAPGLLELRGAQGVLMPSVDRVGRYFPLTLVRWLADGDAPRRRWWTLAGQAALGGLQGTSTRAPSTSCYSALSRRPMPQRTASPSRCSSCRRPATACGASSMTAARLPARC